MKRRTFVRSTLAAAAATAIPADAWLGALYRPLGAQDRDSTEADVRDAFRQNHERLVQVKNRYDPRNLFRLNANIQPTA